MSLPKCPKCGSEYTYEDGNMLVCPECFHEWTFEDNSASEVLVCAAIVSISASAQKGDKAIGVNLSYGTKVKNIRLIDDGIHNIDCKIDGFGAMKLKSEFVKKN